MSRKRKKRSGVFEGIKSQGKEALELLPESRGALLGVIGAGWIFLFLAIFSLQDLHPVVRQISPDVALLSSWWRILFLFLLGGGLLFFGFKKIPIQPQGRDLGPWAARFWLFAILGAGTYLRLYHLDRPLSPFWDDWGNNLVAMRYLLDQHKFYWMFPEDGREPLFTYFLAVVRLLLPDIPGWSVLRIATWLVDMGALSLLYLTGKELGSRRTGVIAAGLGALGFPMLQLTLTGMRAFSLSFDTALLLLSTFRLLNKPTLFRYAQWGLALAFGVHTYTVFRSMAFGVPFLLLPWVLAPKAERRFRPWAWGLAFYSILLLFGVFSGTFASIHPVFTVMKIGWEKWVGLDGAAQVLFLGWVAAALAAWRESRGKKGESRLAGWAFAVGLAAVIIFPLSRGVGFDDRLPDLSAFRNNQDSGNIFLFLTQKIGMTVRSLFLWCEDRDDLQIFWTPFYDVFSQGLVALGLVYCLARPSWKKAFLLSVGVLGTAVYVLSVDPASTKLICSAPPLFLLAGLALSEIWKNLPGPSRTGGVSWASLGLGLFMALYGIWAGWAQREKLFEIWGIQKFPDTTIADQIGTDCVQNRVYLAPSPYFFGDNTQFVLNRGRKYYILKEHNVVPWNEDYPPRDVVILLDGSQVPGGNSQVIEAIHREFKGAQWTQIAVDHRPSGDSHQPVYMWRVFIEGKSLSSDPGALLYRSQDRDRCLRRYYDTDYGWGEGAILKEELVSGLGDPVPVDQLQFKTFSQYLYNPKLVEFSKEIETGPGGTDWSFRSKVPLMLKIDGKILWRMDRASAGAETIKKIPLEQGRHQVEIRIRCGEDYRMPELKWKNEGDGEWKTL